MRMTMLVTLALALVSFSTGCQDASFVDPGEVGGVAPQSASASRSEWARGVIAPLDKEAQSAGRKAPTAPPDGAAAAADTRPADARQVVYSAAFRVVVADVPGSLASIRAHAEKLGGHLQEVTGGTITVRVPAARFNDAVAFIERVGEVVDRQLRVQDVTEELHDLKTHIDNYEKLRKRFQDLLAKAEKVEDALKIEAELARVSEELDKAKGKLRFVESQVAMSTLRVELNAPQPQDPGGTGPRLPFEWVSQLGAGIVEGQVQPGVRKAGIFGRGPRFKPPPGFVRYYEDTGETEAMDAQGLRLRVQARRNVDKGALPFWSALVRKSLVEGRALAVSDEQTGKDYYVLRGTREVGGKPLGYLLALERNDRRVVVFEAWGPQELVEANIEAMRESALSIDPG
jgi:hypothetical protein